MKKVCCFFGHKDTPDSVKSRLLIAIENLIRNENVVNFYVGNQGNFDSMVYSALVELKQKYPQINYAVVIAYLPTDKMINDFDGNTIYPEGLESVPKRFAISKRNEWMIAKSNYCICYITHNFGGASKCADMSMRKGLKVIELS